MNFNITTTYFNTSTLPSIVKVMQMSLDILSIDTNVTGLYKYLLTVEIH